MTVSTDARLGGTSFSSSVGVANALGGQMNIPELLMAIQIERANILDGQIRDQMEDMQNRNEWLRDANAALQALRAKRPNNDTAVADSRGEFTNSKGEKKMVATWLSENGIKIPEGERKQAHFDTLISNLKGSIDTVNSQSQMDMVRLQGLMDKRNQAFDLITNSLSKFNKSLETVIGNMR
jgi:hypothetical protein